MSARASLIADDPPVLQVEGLLDRDAEGPLLAAFAERPPGAGRVVLDLSGMTYMNSSGIACVVLLLREAGAAGVAITARGLTPHYRQLFEITRIADLIDIEEAIA